MTKIKLSYETDNELRAVLQLLGGSVVRCKEQPAKGKFKRAYIDIKPGVLGAVLATKKAENPLFTGKTS